MEISKIVKVTIVRGSKSVTRAGFGVPLILSTEPSFANTEVRTYDSLASVAVDFATSTSVYKMAAKLFGQERKPPKIKVAKASAPVAQVNTLTPNVINSTAYTVTIDGTEYTFTSDGSATADEIVTGLIAAINADPDAPVTASGTTTLILTADVAGQGFSVVPDANLANVATTPNNGAAEDLMKAADVDKDWYMALLTTRNAAAIQQAALWIETQRKMMIAVSSDAALLTNISTDLASILKARSLSRTAILWSGDQANGPEGAWAGGVLPMDPGSETWKFKTLVGILPDRLTSSQEAQAEQKNINIYTTVAGVGMTSEGKTAVGEFMDVIRGIDWFQAQIEENLFARLVSVPKVPYTDNGVAVLESVIRKEAARAVNVGLFAEGSFELEVGKVADQSDADRQARRFADFKFNARLAGAIHFVEVDGTVSV